MRSPNLDNLVNDARGKDGRGRVFAVLLSLEQDEARWEDFDRFLAAR